MSPSTEVPAALPEPAAAPTPAETPSTSNNALIMHIKILSEYSKDINRSQYAVSKATGFHAEYVRKAVNNLITAVVENNGDVETLQRMYTEGSYSLKRDEVNRLLLLVDKIVNENPSPEDLHDNEFFKRINVTKAL
jgi:hypothetical protein